MTVSTGPAGGQHLASVQLQVPVCDHVAQHVHDWHEVGYCTYLSRIHHRHSVAFCIGTDHMWVCTCCSPLSTSICDSKHPASFINCVHPRSSAIAPALHHGCAAPLWPLTCFLPVFPAVSQAPKQVHGTSICMPIQSVYAQLYLPTIQLVIFLARPLPPVISPFSAHHTLFPAIPQRLPAGLHHQHTPPL